MGVYAASLNSGSNGNCYYIGNSTDAVLVDIGLSCRELEKRMKRMKLLPTNIRAIFISHEHSDHIYGVDVFSSRYNIPVFITAATLSNSRRRPRPDLVRTFAANERITIAPGIHVTAMQKQHDAVDPHSFVVETNGIVTGVFTDIGTTCTNVEHWFSKCHAAFLEANYDEHMLETGKYPAHLKKRIQGNKGHLSNAQALQLFLRHKHESLTNLWLAHLSRDNNEPELALSAFAPHAGNTHIEVASRYRETQIFELGKTPGVKHSVTGQASLF